MNGQRDLRAACSWPPEVAEYPDRRKLSAPTRMLHETLIRLAKGVIIAWERWLHEQS